MNRIQTAVLDKPMPHGRFMLFTINDEVDEISLRSVLAPIEVDEHVVVGFGIKLMGKLGIEVADFREFPKLDSKVNIPTIDADLFVFVRDQEAGKTAIRSLQIKNIFSKYMQLTLQVDGFKYLGTPQTNGHDLTGYEDGTENPLDEDAYNAVVRKDGSTFVALQQWQHNLIKFNGFSQDKKDNTIGRRLSDNEELGGAPANSHVHRTDQGTFTIEADILRRSLPWSNEHGEGLMFMAFCENLDRFEVQMRRMVGLEDGVTDALFTFSKVLNSAYFYCPAISDGQLVLS